MARAVVVLVTGAIIGVLLGGSVWVLRDRQEAPTIIIEDPRADATIEVSVEGAVASPGVKTLGGEARVQDALNAAGGLLANADMRQINPARRLDDGEQVRVPTLVPTPPPRDSPLAGNVAAVPVPTPMSALININTASVAELDTLPRIGPSLAARIIAYREQHGPFHTVDELANVSGISAKMVDDMRSLVTVGP